MRDKEFDDILKQKLESFQAPNDGKSWESLNEKIEQDNTRDVSFDADIKRALGGFTVTGVPQWDALNDRMNADESSVDKDFDADVKAALTGFSMTGESQWNRMEEMLDADKDAGFDNGVRAALAAFATSANPDWSAMSEKLEAADNAEFDDQVKKKVESLDAPYDPRTWPILDEKFKDSELLRKRLLGAKILEIAAVFIALFTFYNVFPELKDTIQERRALDNTEAIISESQPSGESANETEYLSTEFANLNAQETKSADVISEVQLADAGTSSNQLNLDIRESETSTSSQLVSVQESVAQDQPMSSTPAGVVANDLSGTGTAADDGMTEKIQASASNENVAPLEESVLMIDQLELPEQVNGSVAIGLPAVGVISRTVSMKVTIGASYDINALYIPEDRFYANGYAINFSEKNLIANGYSTGAGLIWNYGVWSFETGMYYSSKSYKPNRILQIGQTFDIRTLDFEEIDLHVVQVPLQAHWNFDRKGKTRFYAVGGTTLNLIAAANYDLNASNNFRSPLAGGSNQTKSKTDFEVARVREHILDGAEFSAKSYLTLNAGFGVEYQLNSRFSIFTQPTYSYQVPFFHISDQNGKHLQNASLQLGTRVKLK